MRRFFMHINELHCPCHSLIWAHALKHLGDLIFGAGSDLAPTHPAAPTAGCFSLVAPKKIAVFFVALDFIEDFRSTA